MPRARRTRNRGRCLQVPPSLQAEGVCLAASQAGRGKTSAASACQCVFPARRCETRAIAPDALCPVKQVPSMRGTPPSGGWNRAGGGIAPANPPPAQSELAALRPRKIPPAKGERHASVERWVSSGKTELAHCVCQTAACAKQIGGIASHLPRGVPPRNTSAGRGTPPTSQDAPFSRLPKPSRLRGHEPNPAGRKNAAPNCFGTALLSFSPSRRTCNSPRRAHPR